MWIFHLCINIGGNNKIYGAVKKEELVINYSMGSLEYLWNQMGINILRPIINLQIININNLLIEVTGCMDFRLRL